MSLLSLPPLPPLPQVLLVNGTPITLEGEEGEAIKDCLLRGAIPNQDLINHLLIKAGLLMKPMKVGEGMVQA